MFPTLLKDTGSVWEEGKAVLCQGKISDKDQEIKLLANTAMKVNLKKIEEVVSKISKVGLSDSGGGYSSNQYAIARDLRLVFRGNVSGNSLVQMKQIFKRIHKYISVKCAIHNIMGTHWIYGTCKGRHSRKINR